MTDDNIKRIHWKKGRVQTYGGDGSRDIKITLLVEELDYDDETTLTKALSPAMDWFVGKTRDDGTGGHGGPMIDTHTNAVIGHWKTWGVHKPDNSPMELWVKGVIHRGPAEYDYEFPAADMVWNAAKEGKILGGSWGGNKRAGYIEFNQKTGEVFGNTITRVLPYEISVVRSGVRGPDGMPALPAVPHSRVDEIAAAVKTASQVPGTYSDQHIETSSLAPEDWVHNCTERTRKWLGGDQAREFCIACYGGAPRRIKEVLGADITVKELEENIIDLRSMGEIPEDATTAVKESDIAQRYVALKSLDMKGDKALSDLQRVLDGLEAKTMEEETKKELVALLQPLTDGMKSLQEGYKTLQEDMKSLKTKQEDEEEEDETEETSNTQKELGNTIKSLEGSVKELSTKVDTLEAALKAKKEDPASEEEEEEEPPSNQDEDKSKKELEQQLEAAKKLAAAKEAEASEAKKTLSVITKRVEQRKLNADNPPDEDSPSGKKLNLKKFRFAKPSERARMIEESD